MRYNVQLFHKTLFGLQAALTLLFKKGQFAPWIDAIGGGTEALFTNRLFGIYA